MNAVRTRLVAALLIAAPLLVPLSASAIACGPGMVVDLANSSRCIPAPTFNTSGVNPQGLAAYANAFITLINSMLVPLLFATAFLMLIWGIAKYFFINAANEAEREKGKNFILWGIIGFAVILSLWGLIAVIAYAFPGVGLGGAGLPAPAL